MKKITPEGRLEAIAKYALRRSQRRAAIRDPLWTDFDDIYRMATFRDHVLWLNRDKFPDMVFKDDEHQERPDVQEDMVKRVAALERKVSNINESLSDRLDVHRQALLDLGVVEPIVPEFEGQRHAGRLFDIERRLEDLERDGAEDEASAPSKLPDFARMIHAYELCVGDIFSIDGEYWRQAASITHHGSIEIKCRDGHTVMASTDDVLQKAVGWRKVTADRLHCGMRVLHEGKWNLVQSLVRSAGLVTINMMWGGASRRLIVDNATELIAVPGAGGCRGGEGGGQHRG